MFIMMDVKELLHELKNTLEEERKLLLKLDNPDKLVNVINKKRDLLAKIASFNKEDFEDCIDIIQEIEVLSKRNLTLALNNMQLIDEIFSAIFEDENVEKYNPYGEIEKSKSGILNKKI